MTSHRIGLASNPRNDDILPGDSGDEGGPCESRTLPRDPTVSFFEKGYTRRLADRGDQSRVGPRDLFSTWSPLNATVSRASLRKRSYEARTCRSKRGWG